MLFKYQSVNLPNDKSPRLSPLRKKCI